MYRVQHLLYLISLSVSVLQTVSGFNFEINNNITRRRRQVNGNYGDPNGCILPEHPQFGRWTVYRNTTNFIPGMTVSDETVLQVRCEASYKLNGDAVLVCFGDDWTTPIGRCLKTCPSIYSTPTMRVTCTFNNRETENCVDPHDGTTAKFTCADFYEDLSLDRNPGHICVGGRWSSNIPECLPVCGRKSTKVQPLIVNGNPVTKGDYPWQVAIYNVSDKILLCGGSLLNQRVILTAAHCISDEKGTLLSKEVYEVAVGKYYRAHDDPRDTDAQFSMLYDMFIPRQFKGDIQNYFGDIAILVTQKTFTLSTRVQPVCLDVAEFFDSTRVKYGYVTGWGYTVEHKQPSDVLKELKVPPIPSEICSQSLPEDYLQYLTDDKLCAGFLNSSTSVCLGDSGGGFVVRHRARFYISGIVSLSPQANTEEGGCNSQQYGLYTKVSYHINFILLKEAEFRRTDFDKTPTSAATTPATITPTKTATTPATITPTKTATTPATITQTSTATTAATTQPTRTQAGKCALPEHPASGKWSIPGVSGFAPGMTVQSGTAIQIKCDNGLRLEGNSILMCQGNKWSTALGECLKTCPSVGNTESTEVKCSFKGDDVSCTNPFEGVLAKYKCANFYENPQLEQNPVSVCRDANWDKRTPECVPVCGKKAIKPQTLMVNAHNAVKGDFPWQVAIYTAKDQVLICGGSLISQRVIVTAAHCVKPSKPEVRPEDAFVVAVGKYYYTIDDFRDVREAQFSRIKEVRFHEEFRGVNNNYVADIALLITTRPFVLSKNVQPVCIDWDLKYEEEWSNSGKNLTGYVSGWGFTRSDGDPAANLKVLLVPNVPYDQCFDELPENFQNFLTSDKLCAGYLKNYTAVCLGDAGGGLVFKNDQRYFLGGIVSLGPGKYGGCDVHQYTLYTKISTYIKFIQKCEAEFRRTNGDRGECTGKNCQGPVQTEDPVKLDTSSISCVLPPHPANGGWSIFGLPSSNLSPGQSVQRGTVLKIDCRESFKLDGDSFILCGNGSWSSQLGKCLKTCPPVFGTFATKVTCSLNNKELTDCKDPLEGTIAKYECVNFYEAPSFVKNFLRSCRDGSWDQSQPECFPVCGKRTVNVQPLIINGASTPKGGSPWHVGIYKGQDKEFICSGSLVSQRVVITGATCVADTNGQPNDKENYLVAVGKHYRLFDDSRDAADAQFSKLLEIFLPRRYRGEKENFFGDIAVLITTTTFALSLRVQPICVDWSSKHQEKLTNPGTHGLVNGWGDTSETGKPADDLQELRLPIVSHQDCLGSIPQSFKKFLTSDKFCAGYLDKGSGVCRGDSGGGLVVKLRGRYYLAGVVSVGNIKDDGHCNVNQYALYTKVSSFMEDFISEKVALYRN